MAVQVTDRSIAITGAGAGIGRATALQLAQAGARVTIGDLDTDAANAVTQEIKQLGGSATAVTVDVADSTSFASFLDAAEQAHGDLEVLVNNAGIDWMGPFHEEPEAVTRREIEVNLFGTLTGTRLAMQRMLPRRRGHIVNVSSGVGRIPLPGSATYSATKHAIVGLTESLRLEYRNSGLNFSVIQPAQVRTAMMDGQQQSRFLAVVSAEDVADGIVKAIVHKRFEVWVPAAQGVTAKVNSVLPRRVREALFEAVGVTKISDIQNTSRDAYHRRAFETS